MIKQAPLTVQCWNGGRLTSSDVGVSRRTTRASSTKQFLPSREDLSRRNLTIAGDDDTDDGHDAETRTHQLEQTRSEMLRKKLARQKREEDRVKMMFVSSLDPYDRPLRWWEKTHVKYAFAFPTVRSRLEYLMGSNVVRLTDRKYMLKLMARIRQDHEARQEARIAERKHRELIRTKKLILSRFIPVQEAPPEIREYPLFKLHLYCDSITEQRRRKAVARRRVKISKHLYRLLYPEKPEELEETPQEEEEVPMKQVMVDGVPQMVSLNKDELYELAKHKAIHEDIEKGYMYSKDEYENLHYEAEDVKRLKETKTVNEMYAKAHEIVGFLFTLAGDEKRKRCGKEDEKTKTGKTDGKTDSHHTIKSKK